MSSRNTLYITLQYLRTVNGQNKFHWGLYRTGNAPPSGLLLHATDNGRRPLDLYQEIRNVSDPRKSRSMVVCLKISDSPGKGILEACASSIRLMDIRYLPRGEEQWTCRVWVKEVLRVLDQNRYIKLKYDVDTMERACLKTADMSMEYIGRAKVFNDLSWFSSGSSTRGTTPMDIDSTDGRSVYYGSKPMVIDSTGGRSVYYESKPMVIDSTGGSYLGMDTETHYRSAYY